MATESNREATSRTTKTTRQDNLRPGEQGHLDVVEEQVEVGKREVEKGGVRVKRTVEEKPIEEKVNLREEHVHVERRPVDRPANPDDAKAFQEATLEVRERAEQPVVAKTARVIEEVVIGKDVTQRTETVRDTVHKTDVQVEQIPASGATTGAAHTTAARGFDEFDNDFRSNFATAFPRGEYTYEQLQPAYRYGYNLASEETYRGRDWSTFENDARTRWEQRNPGTWEKFKNSIRYGWERTKAKLS